MNSWLKIHPIQNVADKKVTVIDIEGPIGGSYDWWTGEITGATKEEIKAQLKEIAAVSGDEIIVNINSYGGDVNHGISIHDLLAANPAKVTTRVHGMTASAATIIAMAGNEIEMSDNALFLVHRASTFAWGNAKNIDQVKKDLEKIDNVIAKIYSKRTGKSEAEMLEVMDRAEGNGEWLNSDEAKDLGFIDSIFQPEELKAVASADPSLLKKAGLPTIPQNKIKSITMEENKKPAATEQPSLLDSIKNLVRNTLGVKNEVKFDEATEKAIASAVEKVSNEVKEATNTLRDEVKNELEASYKDQLTQKDTDITAKENKITEHAAKITALEAEVADLTGKLNKKGADGIEAKADADPSLGGKSKKTGNDLAAERNAAALRGIVLSDDEDEETEGKHAEEKK